MEEDFSKKNKEKGAAMRLRLSNSWQDFKQRLRHKHRLVLMDTDTLKENFAIELSGANIFTYVTGAVISLIILSMLLIILTPLRNIVPGYIKPEQREEIARSAQTIDSLEQIIAGHEQMIVAIQNVISGKDLSEEQVQQVETNSEEAAVYRHSKSDSLLRSEIEAKHKQYTQSRSGKRK